MCACVRQKYVMWGSVKFYCHNFGVTTLQVFPVNGNTFCIAPHAVIKFTSSMQITFPFSISQYSHSGLGVPFVQFISLFSPLIFFQVDQKYMDITGSFVQAKQAMHYQGNLSTGLKLIPQLAEYRALSDDLRQSILPLGSAEVPNYHWDPQKERCYWCTLPRIRLYTLHIGKLLVSVFFNL